MCDLKYKKKVGSMQWKAKKVKNNKKDRVYGKLK